MATKIYLAARNASKGVVTIYVEYSHNRKVKRISTDVRVPVKQWDNHSRCVTGTGATAANKKIQAVLESLKTQIRELYLANGSVYPTVAQLNKYREELNAAIQETVMEQPLTEVLVAWMDTKQDWAASTRRNFNTLLYNVQDFEKANKTLWYLSTLTTENIWDWQRWLKKATQGKQQQGYNDATLHKRVRLLRQFLRKRPAPGVDLADEKTKAMHAVMLTTPFVLSQEDLDSIEALSFPHLSRLDKIRDVLILQAFCGLRWSDLSRLESRFVEDSFISIKMKKSAAKAVRVSIPIFRQSRQVLAKYTSSGILNLPFFSEQEFNRGLKEVCQQIPALCEEHTQDYRLRGESLERTKPKWQFVTSHTLRRSFVSICLDKGFAIKEVMSWSGHSDLKSFQRYVGSTAQRTSSILEFDQRWEDDRSKKEAEQTTSSVILTLEGLLNGNTGYQLGDDLKRLLQYAASMPPKQNLGDSSTSTPV